MKKYLLALGSLLTGLICCVSCGDHPHEMSSDFPTDYDLNYGIQKVMQYDPMNINGIDIAKKLDFFSTLRLTIHFENSQVVAVTYTNGEVPFSPYDFEVPEGRVGCVLDKTVLPNELRLEGADHVIAYFKNGEFMMPFQLDSKALRYEYTFQNIE